MAGDISAMSDNANSGANRTKFIFLATVPHIMPLIQTKPGCERDEFICWKFHICNCQRESWFSCNISPLIVLNISVTWNPPEDNGFAIVSEMGVIFNLFQPQVNGEETSFVVCYLSVLIIHIMLNYQKSRGILSFLKPHGSYTPPLKPTSIPCARSARPTCCWRWNGYPPIENSSWGPHAIYCAWTAPKEDHGRSCAWTGLKKIYGDGQGTMQYVTSMLNKWGEFVTTVVVAAEAEQCYHRMAHGLMARFQRATAAALQVLYVDAHCCRDGGISWLESLFQDWVNHGLVIRLHIWHCCTFGMWSSSGRPMPSTVCS